MIPECLYSLGVDSIVKTHEQQMRSQVDLILIDEQVEEEHEFLYQDEDFIKNECQHHLEHGH